MKNDNELTLLNEEGNHIKHLNPIKYRRLRKMLKDYANPVPKDTRIILHIYYFDSNDLYADLYIQKENIFDFIETIQTFSG